jgi:hypothetical protein
MTVTIDRTSTNTEQELVQRCREMFSRARQKKRNLYENWQRNYKLVHNKWAQAGLNNSNNPNPKDSEIFPVLSSIIAWMTDQKTTININPAVDPSSTYQEQWVNVAGDLTTVLESLWVNNNEANEIKLALWDAFTFGPAFFKTVWDQSLDKGQGNTKFIRVDPWKIYVDPTSSSVYDAEYVIEVDKMSMSEVERRWPKAAVIVDASSGLSDGYDPRPTLDSPTGRAPMANPGPLPGGDGRYNGSQSKAPEYPDTQEVVVYEYWIKYNNSYQESVDNKDDTATEHTFVEARWKCVVIANNQVMMEEWAEDLWSYASHPFDQFLPEDFGELYGIPITDHLAQPQLYINRLLGALQQNAELTGNPIFLESDNSGLERTPIINRPGQRLKVRGAGNMANRPDWLTPPPMPQVVMDMVQFWISRIENISGLGAAIKGGVNGAPSRTPEGVISTIQESSFVRIRSMLGNLEACLMSITKKQADLIIDNYDSKRIMAIVGPSGAKTAVVLKANHFQVPSSKGNVPLEYALMVQAGSSMPTSRQARIAEADQAYTLGIIDRQAWMEAHEYPSWPEVLTRVNNQIAQGLFQPPGARQRAQH